MIPEKTALLRAMVDIHGASGARRGAVFWARPEIARKLIDEKKAHIAFGGEIPAGRGLLTRVDWPLSRYSLVNRVWPGRAIVCIGGGPSLTQDQVDMVRAAGLTTIAVNDAYRIAPFAELNFFCDAEWWQWHRDRAEFKAFAGDKCSLDNSAAEIEDPAVHILANAGDEGVSMNPVAIVTGRNSGFMSLNIGALAGATMAILLGYDGAPAADGRSHWFGGHPRPTKANAWATYREAFRKTQHDWAQSGLRIINCSPGSSITAFEKMDLSRALELAAKHMKTGVALMNS